MKGIPSCRVVRLSRDSRAERLEQKSAPICRLDCGRANPRRIEGFTINAAKEVVSRAAPSPAHRRHHLAAQSEGGINGIDRYRRSTTHAVQRAARAAKRQHACGLR